MARFCNSCGAQLKDGAKFCESCGAKAVEERPHKPFCSSCGKELTPDAAFCPFCGAKRNGAAPTAVAAASTAPTAPTAAGQAPIPPRAPASQGLPDYMQPGYRQRVRAERETARESANPKKSNRGLSLFLSVVLVAEVCVAGFKYPGFLNKGKTGTVPDTPYVEEVPENPYVKVIDTSSESESKSLMRTLSPGNPANLTVVPDAEKIAGIRPVTAQVSPENPVCTTGDITADFGMWNLDEEDTFEMRTLGAAEDTAKVIEKDWADIVSLMTTAAGFYPPASMACFLFGLLFYYIQLGIVYVDEHNPMDMQDAVYRYYMNRHSGGLLHEDHYLKLNGKGWPEFIDDMYETHKKDGTMNTLEADLQSALDHYINIFWLYMDESDRRLVCSECVKDYQYLILEEPLSAQYYMDMEGGWEEPPKAYPAEYMRNAKDILCRNTKGAFEAMALKYLDETEKQLKKDIYETVLPELNEYMIFEINPNVIENYLASPYVDKSPFNMDGKYAFSLLYPYSYSAGDKKAYEAYKDAAGEGQLSIRFAPDAKAFFRPYEVNVLFKPLNMQNYDFSTSYVPHARFNYRKDDVNTFGDEFIVLHGWIYHNAIKPEHPENVVFVCKKYYYLMAGCPTAMQIKDAKDKNASWTDCKLEIGGEHTFSMYDVENYRDMIYSPTMKGMDTSAKYVYVTVTPGSLPAEKKPDDKPLVYPMVLASNSLIDYEEPTENAKNGDWLTYTKYGADNTITLEGDKISISLNAIEYVWKNSSVGEEGESMVYTFKRDAVEASGTLNEVIADEDDGYIMKKYTLRNPPAISGSYKEESDWDPGRRYYDNKYSASEWKSINSYSLTKQYTQTASTGGTARLYFDKTGTKLRKAVVSLGGSGEYVWWLDERYARVMAEVMEGSGREQKGFSFEIVLRSPD